MIQFGLNADSNVGGLPIALRIATISDEHRLDLIGVQDHPYNSGFYGTFTVITWLAARTSRVRFFPTWHRRPAFFAGKHYQVPGTQPSPQPAHRIRIWLGVIGWY